MGGWSACDLQGVVHHAGGGLLAFAHDVTPHEAQYGMPQSLRQGEFNHYGPSSPYRMVTWSLNSPV